MQMEMNERLIRSTAKSVYYRYVYQTSFNGKTSVEDLLHYGYVGCLDAKKKFDPARGDWPAYSKKRIFGAMLDHLRRLATIPLPQDQRRRVKELESAQIELSFEQDEVPPEQLAEKLGWSVDEVREVQSLQPVLESIDRNFNTDREDDQYCHPELTERNDPGWLSQKEELGRIIQLCLEGIASSVDRLVFQLRLLEERTLSEAAEILGCSMERVRQRQKNTVDKMRTCLEKNSWHKEDINLFFD